MAQSPQNPNDEVAIRILMETWHRATAAGDVPRILASMAEGVVFLTAENPPLRGRAAFAQALTAILKTHAISSSGEIQELRVSGDLAYCWTELSVTLTPLDGGEPKLRKGPVLSILGKQRDGVWVLLRDANMLTPDTADLALKVDNLERELMADGPGGD